MTKLYISEGQLIDGGQRLNYGFQFSIKITLIATIYRVHITCMSRLLYRLFNSSRDYFTPYMYVNTLGSTNEKKKTERMVANVMPHD